MNAAKESVKNFVSKDGQHDTTVYENVAPAAQRETVSKTEHQKIIPALDREVHQHHYHTTEQPVQHSETLPETHHHKAVPVEHRTFDHGQSEDVKSRLAEEKAKYKDTSTRVQGEQTKSTEATLAGEHVHHHVHETIQPVVHKQTIEPHVVHTTVPIHEVHHNAAQHHSATSLPPVSMEEFKRQGGSLKGREERKDFFPGEPKAFPGENGMQSNGAKGIALDGHGADPKQTTADYSKPSEESARTNTTSTTSTTSTGASTAASKPSLLDKLNPKKDADGDGKAGFLS